MVSSVPNLPVRIPQFAQARVGIPPAAQQRIDQARNLQQNPPQVQLPQVQAPQFDFQNFFKAISDFVTQSLGQAQGGGEPPVSQPAVNDTSNINVATGQNSQSVQTVNGQSTVMVNGQEVTDPAEKQKVIDQVTQSNPFLAGLNLQPQASQPPVVQQDGNNVNNVNVAQGEGSKSVQTVNGESKVQVNGKEITDPAEKQKIIDELNKQLPVLTAPPKSEELPAPVKETAPPVKSEEPPKEISQSNTNVSSVNVAEGEGKSVQQVNNETKVQVNGKEITDPAEQQKVIDEITSDK